MAFLELEDVQGGQMLACCCSSSQRRPRRVWVGAASFASCHISHGAFTGPAGAVLGLPHCPQGSAAPLLPPCPLLTPSALPLFSGASLWVRGISSSVAGQLQRACLASSHLPGAPKMGSCLAPTLLRLGMPSSRAQGCPMDAPALEDVPWTPGARI